MKYYKTLNLYKASNVTFDPSKCKAVSYGWWEFVSDIGGVIVFNNYHYSISTQRHQRKVRGVMRELGIVAGITIESPGGLQDLESARKYYMFLITELEAAITRKGSRKAKNEERHATIVHYQQKLADVDTLLYMKGH